MPHEPTYKYVEKTGIDKPMKQIIEVYDEHYGHYENEAGIKKVSSPKPAHQTKSPFGGLHGGK